MTSRPTALFLALAPPAAALGQVSSGADRLPLLWMWIVAAVILFAAVAWLLFGGRTRARRRSGEAPPP